MKKLLAIALLALMATGCATHNVTMPDGSSRVITGSDAEWIKRISTPQGFASLDDNGPAPSQFLVVAGKECSEGIDNMGYRIFPGRTYWALRGAPALAGYNDKQLGMVQAETCKERNRYKK